jgi:hypothetical protein
VLLFKPLAREQSDFCGLLFIPFIQPFTILLLPTTKEVPIETFPGLVATEEFPGAIDLVPPATLPYVAIFLSDIVLYICWSSAPSTSNVYSFL